MSDEPSKFIKIPYTRTKASNEIICCTTCNFTSREFNRYNEHRFRKCKIRNHTNYYNFYKDACDDSQKYQICRYCVKFFKNSYMSYVFKCRCHETLYDLCDYCNYSVDQYIQGKSHCKCEDPIYHRYCDCVYHTLAEYTEVEYDKKMGDDYFNPEKFHNTFLFNRHRKKTLKKPDNWKEETRRIRFIEQDCTKIDRSHISRLRYNYYYIYKLDELKYWYNQFWYTPEYKTLYTLNFKCDCCSEKAIFESSDGEYLCYQCNDKIESEIEKKTKNKVFTPSKFSVQKYKTEYEYNSGRKLNKKRTTKNFLKDYDDYYHKEFSNRKTTVLISDKKISKKEVISEQKIPPFWCETIHTDTTSWVSRIAPEKEAEKKLMYEEAYPKLPSYTCIICIEDINANEKIIKLSCDHYYHKKCIERWCETTRNCPVCRTPI
jgi:hypothetical protein